MKRLQSSHPSERDHVTTTILSSRSRLLAVVVATSLVAPSVLVAGETTVFAQPKKKPLREQLPPEAQKHWDAAIALYGRGLWDGARTSFNAAYDASKNPRVLFNVAVCEKNLQRFPRAIEIFKKELAEGAGQLTKEEEAEIKTQIVGLEAFVAQLTVDVNEPGADIYVDENKVGTSPLAAPVSVPVGERHVRATKVGFAEGRETIELKGGGSGRVQLKLIPSVKTSLVNVNVIGPSNAIVKVDGKEVGGAPYRGQVGVSPEPHAFSAEAPGYVTATQSAVVREGEALNLTLQLSQEQAKGKLVILTRPEGAVIEIDGKTVGATKWEGPVDAGTHQVVAKKQGFYQYSYDVEVPKGGERTVTAQLNEDRNTSFVPWLIGTVLVVGASSVAIYFITRPKDEEPVKGSLPPFTVGTPSVRF